MEVQDKIFNLWVNTLKSPTINKYERAEAIKEYMKSHNLSIRSFGEKFDIPKSTVEDWLLVLKIEKGEYKELINEGRSHTEVYRMLRDNKRIDIPKTTKVERNLLVTIRDLNQTKNVKKTSENIDEILDDLKKAINTFEFRLERFRNGK